MLGLSDGLFLKIDLIKSEAKGEILPKKYWDLFTFIYISSAVFP